LQFEHQPKLAHYICWVITGGGLIRASAAPENLNLEGDEKIGSGNDSDEHVKNHAIDCYKCRKKSIFCSK
jgi:hypothetical protein